MTLRMIGSPAFVVKQIWRCSPLHVEKQATNQHLLPPGMLISPVQPVLPRAGHGFTTNAGEPIFGEVALPAG